MSETRDAVRWLSRVEFYKTCQLRTFALIRVQHVYVPSCQAVHRELTEPMALYAVSVRSLTGAGENVVGGDSSGRRLRDHSQASTVATSPQLPSPGAWSYDEFKVNLLREIPKLDAGDLYPINSRP